MQIVMTALVYILMLAEFAEVLEPWRDVQMPWLVTTMLTLIVMMARVSSLMVVPIQPPVTTMPRLIATTVHVCSWMSAGIVVALIHKDVSTRRPVTMTLLPIVMMGHVCTLTHVAIAVERILPDVQILLPATTIPRQPATMELVYTAAAPRDV
jgi:hypothetical protein